MKEIEKEFEEFMVAMYGTNTIHESQEKDMEKSFYAGMLVTYNMVLNLSGDADTAEKQLVDLRTQLREKMTEIA